MKLILKVIVVFVVVALLLLLVLSYLEKKQGLDTPASEILQDIKTAGEDAAQSADEFLDETGIKKGAADLLSQGAALLHGSPAPDEEPTKTPSEDADKTDPEDE